MIRVAVDRLRECAALPRPLFHESGAVLFEAGERLGAGEIESLLRHGICKVYDLGGEPVALERAARAEAVLGAHMPPEVVAFREEVRARTLRDELDRALPRAIREERLVREPRSALREGPLEALIESSAPGEVPTGARWRERAEQARPLPPRSVAEKRAVLAERAEQIRGLAELYAALDTGEPAPFSRLLEIGRGLCLRTVLDPDLMLCLLNAAPIDVFDLKAAAWEGLARRGWNVAVLAVAAGLQLDYGLEQLLELSLAAFVHDLGALGGNAPVSTGMCAGELEGGEDESARRAGLRHALGVLRRFDRLACGQVSVSLAPFGVQPEAGSGHFARLIGGCHTVERLATNRNGEGFDHEVVREAAALASKRAIDAAVLRAILTAVSLFPVGSWVRLEDGAIGRIVRASGRESARPLVRLWEQGRPGRLVDLAECAEVRIEPIAPPIRFDLDPLVGF